MTLNPYQCSYRLNGQLVCREGFDEYARSRMPVFLTEHKGELPGAVAASESQSTWTGTLLVDSRPAAAAAPLVGSSSSLPAPIEPGVAYQASRLSCPRPLQRPPLPQPFPQTGTNTL